MMAPLGAEGGVLVWQIHVDVMCVSDFDVTPTKFVRTYERS